MQLGTTDIQVMLAIRCPVLLGAVLLVLHASSNRQMASLQVGITLTAAEVVVFAELVWTPA